MTDLEKHVKVHEAMARQAMRARSPWTLLDSAEAGRIAHLSPRRFKAVAARNATLVRGHRVRSGRHFWTLRSVETYVERGMVGQSMPAGAAEVA